MFRMLVVMRRSGTWCMLAAAATMPACGTAATEGGYDSPVPAAKMHATLETARSGDGSDIAALVEQLDSDDAGVRSLAITTLRQLTGETLGYRHDDPIADRRAAVARWVEYVEARETAAAPVEGVATNG
jgi:hypothetical protein